MKLLDVMIQYMSRRDGTSPQDTETLVLENAKESGLDISELQQEVTEEDAAVVTSFLQKSYEEALRQQQESQRIPTPEEADRIRLQSSRALKALHKDNPSMRIPAIPMKSVLRMMGQEMWPNSYALAKEDIEATKAYARYLNTLPNSDPRVLEQRLIMSGDRSYHHWAAARWADCAFPVVQLAGHKYAAALMSTSASGWSDIRPPWKAFMIDLPVNLISIDMNGDEHWITSVMVWWHDTLRGRVWSVIAYTDKHGELHSFSRTTDELLVERSKDDRKEPDAFELPLDDRDARIIFLVSRLAMNVCLAMSDPDQIKQIGKHPKGWSAGPGRRSKEPIYRVFRVGKPVVIDCRPALQDFLRGIRKGSAPTVQFLVRGHWRNQACGPRMTQRRPTWIEPYWKGPEDAPINVRPHAIDDIPGS